MGEAVRLVRLRVDGPHPAPPIGEAVAAVQLPESLPTERVPGLLLIGHGSQRYSTSGRANRFEGLSWMTAALPAGPLPPPTQPRARALPPAWLAIACGRAPFLVDSCTDALTANCPPIAHRPVLTVRPPRRQAPDLSARLPRTSPHPTESNRPSNDRTP